MALHDTSKMVLKSMLSDQRGRDIFIRGGASVFWDMLQEITAEKGADAIDKNIMDNREEAEKYLAGLLGMM